MGTLQNRLNDFYNASEYGKEDRLRSILQDLVWKIDELEKEVEKLQEVQHSHRGEY